MKVWLNEDLGRQALKKSQSYHETNALDNSQRNSERQLVPAVTWLSISHPVRRWRMKSCQDGSKCDKIKNKSKLYHIMF